MATNSPKVSIIILNWNGLTDTTECLESLLKITYPNYNVILVDNASEGDDVDILRQQYGDYIEILQNDENYGFAKGNNIGVRHALERDAAYVLLLNNDTTVDPRFLDELILAAEGDRGLGILCPMIYWYHQPDKVWFGGGFKVSLWRGTCTQDRRLDLSQPVIPSQVATGAAMLVRRETIGRIGVLPEYYFFGIEDFDYSFHAVSEGFRIGVVANAKVWHKGSASAGEMNVARIGYSYRGWQIMRHKYLSNVGYVLATVCGIVFAALRFSTLLLGNIRRGDCHGVWALFQKTWQGLKGTIQGSFS